MVENEVPQEQPEEHKPIELLTGDTEELKSKAVSSFGWATFQQIFGRLASFAVNLALARLLVPEDFGTIAVLNIFIAIATQISDVGFGSSLSRTEKLDEADLSTIFYYNVGMSCLMYLVLFFAAPFIADYFNNPILTWVLRVQLLSLVISSLTAIHSILLYRQMKFRQDLYLQMTGTIVSSAVGVGMAFLGFKYWALVAMGLSAVVVRTPMILYYVRWYPKRIFSMDKIRQHFAFGSRIMLNNLIGTIAGNFSTILVARYFDTRTLGLYNNASALQQVPVSALSDPVNKVTYPVFVRIQADMERLKAGYSRVMRLVFQLTAPIMVLLSVLSYPLYHFIYGDKWMDAAPFFQILCICAILFPINSYNINIMQAKGRGDLYLRLGIVRRVIDILGLIIGLQFGIYGVIWSAAIVQVIFLPVNSYYSGMLINYSLKQQLLDLYPFALMSVAAGAIVWGADTYLWGHWADFFRLALGGIVMGLSYLVLGWLFARRDVEYVWGLVQHYVLRRG